MNTLYIISEGLRVILNSIAESDGEITPEQESLLVITQQELEAKGVNYAFAIRELDSTVDAIDAEIERLKKLKEKPKALSVKLKEKIGDAMKEFDVEKIESATIKLSFRKSKETIIEDESTLPESCFEIKRTVSKTKVKELIESGMVVSGAYILEKKSLQIK
jgi:hypothetical protein